MRVEAGQLRRWVKPGYPSVKGKVFLVLGVKTDWTGTAQPADTSDCWDFIMDSLIDWHYGDILIRGSEVISGNG